MCILLLTDIQLNGSIYEPYRGCMSRTGVKLAIRRQTNCTHCTNTLYIYICSMNVECVNGSRHLLLCTEYGVRVVMSVWFVSCSTFTSNTKLHHNIYIIVHQHTMISDCAAGSSLALHMCVSDAFCVNTYCTHYIWAQNTDIHQYLTAIAATATYFGASLSDNSHDIRIDKFRAHSITLLAINGYQVCHQKHIHKRHPSNQSQSPSPHILDNQTKSSSQQPYPIPLGNCRQMTNYSCDNDDDINSQARSFRRMWETLNTSGL